MNPELWRNLEQRALWLLEHPDQAPPREALSGMALQVRLWRYARSSLHVTWSVLLPARDHRTRRGIVREMTWDRLADWRARMSSVKALKRRQVEEPTIVVRDAEVGWSDLAPFVERVGGLRSPSPTFDPASSREDDFGLEGYRSLAHVRLQWYGKGPRSWRGTVTWIGRLRALLVRTLRERERSV